jgi:hydrogenase-4 component B
MQIGMIALASACIVLGVGAFLIVPALGQILAGVGSVPGMPMRFTLDMPLGITGFVGEMSLPAVAAGLLLLSGLTWILLRLFADRRLRIGDTWGCGRISRTPRMEYTSTAYAEPLRRIFAELVRPTENLSIDFHPESKYFVQSIEYKSGIEPWFERLLYVPLVSFMQAASRRVRLIQAGSLHLYLAYMAMALLAALLASRWLG